MLIWFKKVSSVNKLPISNGESFLESIFDLKLNLQNIAYTKPLNLMCPVLYFPLRKCSDDIQNVKKKFEGVWAELRPKLPSDNPGQNIWKKVEKCSKTGQDKKSLISTFMCLLNVIAKV